MARRGRRSPTDRAWRQIALGQLAVAVPLLAVGLGVGLLAGTFGVGGGILAVPALVLFLHLDQHVAEGTSLAMILPTSAFAAYRYSRRGSVRPAPAAAVGGAAVLMSFSSSHLALALPSRLLRVLFALFLLFISARTALHDARPRGERRSRAAGGVPVQLGIGGVVGLLAGLLGVGGGAIATPGLVLLCDFPEQVAQGTSLAAITLSSAAGATGYALAGRVDWLAAAALFAGAAVTVPLGTRVAHTLSERALRRAFAAFVVVVAVAELATSL